MGPRRRGAPYEGRIHAERSPPLRAKAIDVGAHEVPAAFRPTRRVLVQERLLTLLRRLSARDTFVMPSGLHPSVLIALAAAAVLARAYAQAHGLPIPPLRLYAAVAAAAWFGGSWAGLAVVLLAATAQALLHLPSEQLWSPGGSGLVEVALFTLEASLLACVVALVRRVIRRNAEQAYQHRSLAALSRLAIASGDLRGLCAAATRSVADALASQWVSVHALDATQDTLRREALYGECEDALAPSSVLLHDAPLAQKALASGSAALEQGSARTSVSVPISGHRRSYGVLTACARRRKAFGRDELQFLEAVANLLATSIERDRAQSDARDGQRALALLAAASHELAGSLERATVIETALRLVVPALADVCILHLPIDGGGTQRFVRDHSDAARALRMLESPTARAPTALPSEALLLDLSASADPVAELGCDADCVERLRQAGVRSVVRVPLHARERQVGVMWLGADGERGAFDRADLGIAGDLARRVAMTLDNARLYSERAESDRRKDELLAMLSHELRNPLAGLVNNLELLRLEPMQPGTHQRAVDAIGRQTRFIKRIVDDLLDVSRITRGAIELHRAPTDLGAITRLAVDTASAGMQSHGLRLGVTIPEAPLFVDADPIRIEQIVGNLLDNASKYGGPGGLIDVDVRMSPHPGYVEVIVRDDGRGIPSERLAGIFELFARSHPAGLATSGGLGVGLFLVRRLVELHGGSVAAFSEGAGRGSEFVVRLPRIAAPDVVEGARDAASPIGAAPTLDPGARLKIVIVDDHRDSVLGLAELVRSWGHDVHTAFDGPSGLALVRAIRPALALVDIGLPGLDGYGVARAIRSTADLASLRLVAVTGYGFDEDRRKALDAGFDQHFTKPLDASALRGVIHDAQEADGRV